MINLVRCDDRLIHGQCMTVIVKEYDIEEIIVVDDFTATNAILKSVFNTAVPPSMKADVFTIQDSVSKIKEAKDNNVKTLVLMKSPIVYLELLKAVDDLPKELNVGPMTKRKGSTPVTPTIHLMPDEAEAVKEATSMGARVWFRQVPEQPTVEWDEVKDKF